MELQKIQDENLLWKLFKSTFIISAFTIGGGFVIIPLLMNINGWMIRRR